jgi:threonine dehydrogenase-like Zn-dependent dehydrogenase
MNVLQIEEGGRSTVLEMPRPEPGPGQVLLRVLGVATCPQWDLHLRHNEPMFLGHKFHYPYTPGQPGHEATGAIESVGPDVTEVAAGDRVSAWRDAGHERPGCYAQFVLLDAANVIRVPPHLPLEATASVELAMCVGASFLMLREMNVIEGRRFGVNGLGPAGLIAAQMARAEGASEVIGFDLSAERCDYAVTVSAVCAAHDPRTAPESVAPMRSHAAAIQTGIDCVGAKTSVEWLMDHVRDALALFGVQRESYSFTPRHYHPALRLCGYPGHSRAAAEYAVSLIERGLLDLAPLVTHRLPLERYDEGIDLLSRQQAIKILYLPWNQESPG